MDLEESELSVQEIMDAVISDCPIYQDDGVLCEGYGEGELCGTECRYYRQALDIVESEAVEAATRRNHYIHGTEI